MDGISACLNDIATIYETNGNYKKALSFYKRSLKIREEFEVFRTYTVKRNWLWLESKL